MFIAGKFLTNQSLYNILKSVFSSRLICFCISLSLAIISLATCIVFLMKPLIVSYSGHVCSAAPGVFQFPAALINHTSSIISLSFVWGPYLSLYCCMMLCVMAGSQNCVRIRSL